MIRWAMADPPKLALTVLCDRGVMLDKHNVMYEGNTRVTINNNQAKCGEAMYIDSSCYVTFKETLQ